MKQIEIPFAPSEIYDALDVCTVLIFDFDKIHHACNKHSNTYFEKISNPIQYVMVL